MGERDKKLKSIGSLIGRAAGHGILYGPAQREAVLYAHQAKDKVDRLGKLFRGETDIIRDRALEAGADTIHEAFREGKRVMPATVGAAMDLLPDEVDRVIRKVI